MQEKTIDFTKITYKIPILNRRVFYGDNDPYVRQVALADLAKGLAVTPVIIHNGGHLNSAAGFSEFPQLLTALTEIIEA